ncbi:hypothetical protein [Moraxella sp. ZY210820]|uniref:hypothetical protein n=1 Tax=unclassified Moraxella TaxID=2685852 RepID=UPI002730A692|nr:hypothetical protein [Moraxella sp. ZY210820]WLF84599.1 hypothetical protein LU301_03760 [Moraxella sp. ZY210820]
MFLFPSIDKEIYPLEIKGFKFNSSKDFILGTFGGLKNVSLDKITYEKYNLLLEKSPKLTKKLFPSTYKYVKDEKYKDSDLMTNELKDIDIYLSEGQTVFHGGDCPLQNPKIGDILSVSPIFSATINPQEASLHALQNDKNIHYFWSIELSQNTRVFPACIEDQNEFEVIILDGLNLKVVDIQQISDNQTSMTFLFLEQI